MQQNNTYAVHYEAARITRIMCIFEPVELVNNDLIYEAETTNGDDDSIPDPDAN